MKGSATQTGTQRYRERQERRGISPSGYRVLGRTGWTTSVVGFGCYRIEETTPSHRLALEHALSEGCNLIDTSTNYGDGSSELCVGHAMTNLFGSSKLQRDEVILISKVGYVQGQNLNNAKEREAKGNAYPEMVKYAEGCWHCIHPEFIKTQLSQSLDRTSQRQLDVYLLHNPEYFFSDALNRSTNLDLKKLRQEFYRRIRAAFEQLETEVAEGRIQAYGVSSNTLGHSPEDPQATSLEEFWKIAEEISQDRYGDTNAHHFSVIQFPMNLFEGGAILTMNQGNPANKTVLDFAIEKDLGVITNRPLNAIISNQMVRLADFPIEPVSTSLEEALHRVTLLEQEFLSTIASVIRTHEGSSPASSFFRWGRELSRPELKEVPLEHWSHLEKDVILPQVHEVISALNQHFENSPAVWESWRDRYLPQLRILFSVVRKECAQKSHKVRETISQRLNDFLPSNTQPQSLSQRSLSVLANTRGVTCVLNGMREIRYVNDSLGIFSIPPFLVKKELYESFQQAKQQITKSAST